MRPTLLLLGLSACGSTLGDATADLNRDFIIPYLMAAGDLGSACAVGEALGPMVASFARDSRKAARASVLSTVSSAMCLEDDAREADLAQTRAFREGRFADAQDLGLQAARHHAAAARRFLDAYTRLDDVVGVPEPGEACPRLNKATDQLTWMLGLNAGLLAVVHDGASGGAVGVPLNIPAAVIRGATCLDNAAWWGAPDAMTASVFVLQPNHPDADDPWARFEASVAKGNAAAVRLASAYRAQAAATVGDDARLREAIRADAAARAATPSSPQWAMLDAYAHQIVLHESDRLWTAQTGHRTPLDAYGTFPDDAAPEEAPPMVIDLFE